MAQTHLGDDGMTTLSPDKVGDSARGSDFERVGTWCGVGKTQSDREGIRLAGEEKPDVSYTPEARQGYSGHQAPASCRRHRPSPTLTDKVCNFSDVIHVVAASRLGSCLGRHDGDDSERF